MTLEEFRDYVEKEGVDGGDEAILLALIEVAKAAKAVKEADFKEFAVFQAANLHLDLTLAALDKELEG